MSKLTAEERKHISKKNFALLGGRYPIEDKSHAQNALARVSQNGTPEEKAKVRAKVHAKYPSMGAKHQNMHHDGKHADGHKSGHEKIKRHVVIE